MPEQPTSHPISLRLGSPTQAGRDLRLGVGDVLLAVNGIAFQGTEADLTRRFVERRGTPLALTFRRDDHKITVLAETAKLGTWQVGPAEDFPSARINPDSLRNFEILRNSDGVYDLHALHGELLALIAAPIWLLQMRLWVTVAAFVAAAMVAFVISPLMCAAVYLCAGLHVWHAGPAYVRRDRKQRGLVPHLVLAAPTERAAHASYLKLEPTAQFLFAPTAPPATESAG